MGYVRYIAQHLPPFDTQPALVITDRVRTTVSNPITGNRHGLRICHEGDEICVYGPPYCFRAVKSLIGKPLDEWAMLQSRIDDSFQS